MRQVVLIALVGASQAVQLRQKFIEDADSMFNDHTTLNQLNMQIKGIDIKELQPDNQHKVAWPMGVVDNGTDDHTVLGHLGEEIKKPEVALEKISNREPIRPAVVGQWPLGSYENEHKEIIVYGKVDDGTDDDTVINAQMKAQNLAQSQGQDINQIVGVKPMEHYLKNPNEVPEAQRGRWPVGQYTDQYGVTHRYGEKDDGTDDHTILNAQVNGQRLSQWDNGVKPMEYYINNPNEIPQAKRGQWPIGRFTDEFGVTHVYGTKDDGTDDHTILNAQVNSADDGVKPMEHYLKNPHEVPQAQPGRWPVGSFTDQWGVVHKYGEKDDGTDDHTILNAQREIVTSDEKLHI